MTNKTVILLGNPNCGKSTLFNRLTNSVAQTGNRAQVTIEKQSASLVRHNHVTLVDLPGIYSFNSLSNEERITILALEKGCNLIVNVVDCTQLYKSLFLTSQLKQADAHVVVALNMFDEAEKSGIYIDIAKLQKAFGFQFVKISAKRNFGLEELEQTIIKNLRQHYFVDTKISTKPELIYKEINGVLSDSVFLNNPNKKTLTQKIDSVVTNKYLAFPILAVILTCVFSFSSLANGISSLIKKFIFDNAFLAIETLLHDLHSPQWIKSFVLEGLFEGVVKVLEFLPQIMLLFFAISFLEEIGYTARISFITDRLIRNVGLSGKSFVCLVLACGCAVNSTMASRTLTSKNERFFSVCLCPMMPCSAKLTVIWYFTNTFFNGNALVAVAFYFLSLVAVCVGGLILKIFLKNEKELFVFDLPKYRLPDAKTIFSSAFDKALEFVSKTTSIILICSCALWFLKTFSWKMEFCAVENSILCSIGKSFCWIFAPLGFGKWQFAVATLFGFSAKESILSTLSILSDTNLLVVTSPQNAFCFVTFNLLTLPCIATVSSIFAEMGKRQALLVCVFQFVFSYSFTLLLNFLLLINTHYSFSILIVLSLLIFLICFAFKSKKSTKCSTCRGCNLIKKCKK